MHLKATKSHFKQIATFINNSARQSIMENIPHLYHRTHLTAKIVPIYLGRITSAGLKKEKKEFKKYVGPKKATGYAVVREGQKCIAIYGYCHFLVHNYAKSRIEQGEMILVKYESKTLLGKTIQQHHENLERKLASR